MIPWRNLRTGAAIAAACWTILQLVGGYVVGHQLQRASELYGTFGIVLGLLAWLFLQAEVTLYAAEVDVVLTRRLWPKSVMPAEIPEPAAAARPAEGTPSGTAQPVEPARAAQDGQPGEAAPVSVPAPRAAAERGGENENRTAGWFSRARRAVGRR
jgi:Virulence factor BrkB